MKRTMEEKAQILLSKSYAPAVLNRLSRLPSRDQPPIASWLIKTPIGTNYALQILEQIEDLAKKEESAPAQLLTQVLMQMKADKLQPKELGRRVRDQLSKRLHPTSVEHHEAFWVFTKELGLSKGIELRPPQNFEGNIFTLEVHFQDPDELRERLQEVFQSLKTKAWKRLKEF
jgi:hypothetical protein